MAPCITKLSLTSDIKTYLALPLAGALAQSPVTGRAALPLYAARLLELISKGKPELSHINGWLLDQSHISKPNI
jgi:hypothetical protein